MKQKSRGLKRIAIPIIGGGGFVFGMLTFALPPPFPPTAPFIAIGLPMLLSSYRPARLWLSHLRNSLKFVDHGVKILEAMTSPKFLRKFDLIQTLNLVLKLTRPRSIRLFRAQKQLSQNKKKKLSVKTVEKVSPLPMKISKKDSFVTPNVLRQFQSTLNGPKDELSDSRHTNYPVGNKSTLRR